MFKRILLALDGSESGQVAISFTIALAASCQAEVRIIHVSQGELGGWGLTWVTPYDARYLVDDATLQFRCSWVTATGAALLAPATTTRSVSESIVDEARHWAADAIVLGSRRRCGLRRVSSRGVREQVTRLSCLPVLTAPAPLRVAGDELVLELATGPGRDGPTSRLHR
jgi:nucleotide-binding universal stress UspA family protein